MRALLKTLLLLTALHRGDGKSPHQKCPLKGRAAPHELYCDRYLTCYRGEVYVTNCPNGLVFWPTRAVLHFCAYPSEAKYACLNKQLANEPISTEHCEWLYGIFGHETSCTRYWTCWNGTATEQFCIGGLLYNEKTHGCDWPQYVDDCQKHPLCAEDSNGNVPLGNSCERYWSCQGGYPRLMRCPATMVFDKTSTHCVQPPTADCDVPPPEEIDGEEEDDVDALVVIPTGGRQLQGDDDVRPQEQAIVGGAVFQEGASSGSQQQRKPVRIFRRGSTNSDGLSPRGHASFSASNRASLRVPAVPAGAIRVP